MVAMRRKKPFIIAIAGGSGSGKSCLSRALIAALSPHRAAVIELDYYYRDQTRLDRAERDKLNYDHPDSLELSLLQEHLAALRAVRPVDVPQYDYALHTRSSKSLPIDPKPFILVEGILALHLESLRKAYNLKVYIDTPEAVRLERRLARDAVERRRTAQSVLEQWNSTVLPMHRQFCEPTKQYSDLVLRGDSDQREILGQVLNILGIPEGL
ncbi:MAG: uridine kinase [Proteobacteria bacterium]|nr:MAG: uridine kinase [Pseudomonadota bacterium]